ncbi:MAG: hypothetical protein ABFR36_06070 [Acidobacteriota bacterium]
MKKLILILSIVIIFTLTIGSDVIKKSRTEVNFTKYGKFKSERTETVNPEIKRIDSTDKFKGRGLLNKIVTKVFFKSGEFSQIIDLKNSKISRVNHKKKKVVVKEIKKIALGDEDVSESEDESEDEDSDITITKNEFKVVRGDKKVINGFPTIEYKVSWIIEWESNESEAKGSSRLLSDVWATPVTRVISSSQKIESVFFNNYMKKLGLDIEFKQDEILGGSWMRIFTSMSKTSNEQGTEGAAKFKKEISKIKGYPIVVDGKFFSKVTGVKKKKSPFSLLKKKKKNKEEKPKFTFYTEVLDLKIVKSDSGVFEYPAGYKVK